jgi:hypothetical protein
VLAPFGIDAWVVGCRLSVLGFVVPARRIVSGWSSITRGLTRA